MYIHNNSLDFLQRLNPKLYVTDIKILFYPTSDVIGKYMFVAPFCLCLDLYMYPRLVSMNQLTLYKHELILPQVTYIDAGFIACSCTRDIYAVSSSFFQHPGCHCALYRPHSIMYCERVSGCDLLPTHKCAGNTSFSIEQKK